MGLPGMITGLVSRILTPFILFICEVIYYVTHPVWLWLPPVVQVGYLIVKRTLLREKNITAPTLPSESAMRESGVPSDARTFEGSHNNFEKPTMGMTGCPFIKNTPPAAGSRSGVTGGPDPVLISERIFARPRSSDGQTQTKTRPLVNLLGGAWIQFMTHDWFELRKDANAPPVNFPLPDGAVMPLQPAVKNREGDIFNNHDHWWSGCQIYGTTPERAKQIRSGIDGKIKLVTKGPVASDGSYLPLDPQGRELVGFNLNLWSGLQLLHYLFAKEHNTVCDMLKQNHPEWDDAKLFSAARLIITALIARIHTVEWTTAIIQHPAGRASQYFLWYGILGTVFGSKLLWLTKLLRPLGIVSQIFFGIPGGEIVLPGDKIPFAHSDEFVMVYRMHALLPDKVNVHEARTGAKINTVNLEDIIFENGTAVNTKFKLEDLYCTLGIGHAGALELRNYPTAMRNLVTPNLRGQPNKKLDMGAVDVWRSRESRIPLFNDYLEALSLPRYKSFAKLGLDDAEARAALQEVYDNDVDKIDSMVGMLAQAPIPGFIFGEAIYTIFVLQTQRRLESDRFYTQDFTKEMYTKEGMAWVHNTTMSDIIMRHIPLVSHWLKHDTNAFIPWDTPEDGKRRLFEKVIWDLFFPQQVYGWFKAMGYTWPWFW